MIDPSALGRKPVEDKPKVTNRHYVVRLESGEEYYLPELASWVRPYGPEGMAPVLRGLPGLLGLLEGTDAHSEPGSIEGLTAQTHAYTNAKGEEEAIIYLSLPATEDRKQRLEAAVEQQGSPERPDFVRDSFEGDEFKPYSSESAQVNAENKLEKHPRSTEMQRLEKSPPSLDPIACLSTTALAATLQNRKPELFYHLDICGTSLSRLTTQQMHYSPEADLKNAREYLSGFLRLGKEGEQELFALGEEFLDRQEAILALSASERKSLDDKDWLALGVDGEGPKQLNHLAKADYWRKQYEEGKFSNKAGLVQVPGYHFPLNPQDESTLYTDELTDDPGLPAIEKIGKKFEKATNKELTPLEGLAALFEMIMDFARLGRRKVLDNQVEQQLTYLQNRPDKVAELQARLTKESTLLTAEGQLNGAMLAKMTPTAAVELMYAAKMQNPQITFTPVASPGQKSRHQNMLGDLWKRVEARALKDRLASEEVQRQGRQLLEQQRGLDAVSEEPPLGISAVRGPAAAASSSSPAAAASGSPAPTVAVPFSPAAGR